MKRVLQKAVDAIGEARRVVIASHVNPDGDTLGSALAIGRALRNMGKEVTLLSHDGVPEIYRWMPGQECILRRTQERSFDLAIVCDTGTLDRIGDARPAVEAARRTIDIDHHVAEGAFGEIRIVDPRAAATGELAYALLRALHAPMDQAVADCLMCAIVTDTGSFRFLNVTPNTLRIAGALLRLGARLSLIGDLVFEDRSLASLKLLGRALDALQVTPDGAIAWAHVRATDYLELGASDEDTEGIVNHIRSVRGARVGILFREIPGKKVRISLRAKEGVDVNEIAAVFGGGGHMLAAGCTLDPPLEQAEELVLAEVRRRLGTPEPAEV
ncbi:MAG: DHH family phosphoesterase [Chthonomonadales bacterium]